MPVYSRRSLRQSLGQDYIRDTIVGTTTGSWGTQAGSFNILDSAQADPTASGEQLYQRSWLRLLGTALFIQDVRVASFNTGSGAYVGAQTLATTIYSGMPYELHRQLSPAEKDRSINVVIQDLKVQYEFPIWSIDNSKEYSIGPDILDITEVYYVSDPTSSLDTNRHLIDWFNFKRTASGRVLRISPALPASYQLLLDAVLEVSLGDGELATVYLPSDKLVLWGSTAQCLWMLEQRSASQESKVYASRRREAAVRFSRLARRFQPIITRRIMLDEYI